MLDFLKKIFGSKQERDLSKYRSAVQEINQFAAEYQSLSNDELRLKTQEFRERIREYLTNIDEEIANINQQALSAEDFDEKDGLFKRVDELRKDRDRAFGYCLCCRGFKRSSAEWEKWSFGATRGCGRFEKKVVMVF